MNLTPYKLIDLLRMIEDIKAEIKRRKIIRTNNIIGDLGEALYQRTFGWELENNSQAGYDAVDDEERVQIKTRKGTGNTFQFSQIHDAHKKPFDKFAGLVFNNDCSIRFGWMMPFEQVMEYCKRQDLTNSELPIFNIKKLQEEASVDEVTEALQKTMLAL